MYRETGEILDDSENLCKKMEPPGVMKMLIGKKFKVEIWEKYLRTMKKNERARFLSSEKEDCLQYVSVSKMLRDIRDGKKVNNVLRIQCWARVANPAENISVLVVCSVAVLFTFQW